MIRIGLLGYSGRMGQAIAGTIAAEQACVLAAALVRAMPLKPSSSAGIMLTTKIDDVMAASDVVIDFTLAEATALHAQAAAHHRKPFVCGTTGLGHVALAALKQAAMATPVLHAPNTSLSLAVTKRLTRLAAQLLAPFDYDVAILDEHHRMKRDAPSGTAQALGDEVTRGSGGQKTPSHVAVRAGQIVGNHEVIFAGDGETIRLHHSVTDRSVFARGAVTAARWLSNKPAGFYGMDDVVGMA